CAHGGCLMELCIQLSITMLGKQLIQNNLFEIGVPKLKKLIRYIRSKQGTFQEEERKKRLQRYEMDHFLEPFAGLTPEYMEMIIQFGFVTLFVASFPLAPLFALLNNIIEIRLDAKKFVTELRRPVAARAKDIGIWYNLLRGVANVAVIINVKILVEAYFMGLPPDISDFPRNVSHVLLLLESQETHHERSRGAPGLIGARDLQANPAPKVLQKKCLRQVPFITANESANTSKRAFVISFTSDFIPRMVYQYMYSPDGSMHGFVNHTLSYFNVSHFQEGKEPMDPLHLGYHVEMCRYKDYREPPWSATPYEISKEFWTVLAVRLAFVIIFQNVVMLMSDVVDWLIPDIPKDISMQIHKEKILLVELFMREEHSKSRNLDSRVSGEGKANSSSSNNNNYSTTVHPRSGPHNSTGSL
ncbi:hypothetical protein JOQ06_002152, partial [Pogonophryne albipinna]